MNIKHYVLGKKKLEDAKLLYPILKKRALGNLPKNSKDSVDKYLEDAVVIGGYDKGILVSMCIVKKFDIEFPCEKGKSFYSVAETLVMPEYDTDEYREFFPEFVIHAIEKIGELRA